MRCPECQWNVVTLVLETRKWVCKRCKHEWTESNNPGLIFDRVSTKATKRKTVASRKKKTTARKAGKTKKRR
jgi:hypothetical protein